MSKRQNGLTPAACWNVFERSCPHLYHICSNSYTLYLTRKPRKYMGRGMGTNVTTWHSSNSDGGVTNFCWRLGLEFEDWGLGVGVYGLGLRVSSLQTCRTPLTSPKPCSLFLCARNLFRKLTSSPRSIYTLQVRHAAGGTL